MQAVHRFSTWLAALALWAAGGAVAADMAGAEAMPHAEVMKSPRELATPWLYRAPLPLSAQAMQGQRLYLEGIRPDGSPLSGLRSAGGEKPQAVSGAQAACVQCHKRSGLGTVEGDILISPVTGRSLFEAGGVAAVMDMRSRRLLNTAHPPYSADAFATALREGRNANGREMHGLMPRYGLNDTETQALEAYLRTLSPTWSPGVTVQRVRLASVITPDVDPALRKVAVDMIRALVNRKNLGTRPGRRHMVSALEFVLRTERHWEHEIWELTGPSDTWAEQLRERQARNPVFAIASGVMRDGAPLHEFCQREQLPCWFPVAESLPVSAATDPYGLYFSAGVALEADVIALQLQESLRPAAKAGNAGAARVVQLVSADIVGQRAASELERRLPTEGLGLSRRTLDPQQLNELAGTLAALGPQDSLVLWLRPADLAALTALPAPPARVWLGARMSGGDALVLPAAWRERVALAYPYELPEQRVGNLVGLRSWLSLAKLPLVDEAVQSQLYFALTYLNETVGEMLQNLHRDYLVERAEGMLGRRERNTASAELVAQRSLRRTALAQRAIQEQMPQDGDAAVPRVTQAELTTQREGTTIYPRLNLGPGQRFASKGAWVAPVSLDPARGLFAAPPAWIVP